MKFFRFFVIVLLIVTFFASLSSAYAIGFSMETARQTDAERLVTGWGTNRAYTYIYFGNYPYTKHGDIMPVTWRVLGVENDYAFLLTEYVIDYAQYHDEKKDMPTYKDYLIYHTLNEQVVPAMFTEEEQSILLETAEKGKLFYLDNRDLRNVDYGFRNWTAKPQKNRECKPTPYAASLPNCEYIHTNGATWYFSTGMPRRGCHNLIGYDGHTSVAANNRYGGMRPGCYVDLSRLDHVSGSGTLQDPYVFKVITEE